MLPFCALADTKNKQVKMTMKIFFIQ